MFSKLFLFIKSIFDFIQNYFKSLIFLLILIILYPSESNVNSNLAKLYLNGAIFDSSEILEQIRKLKKDDSIKGVLMIVDSPGGSVTHSFEVGLAIKELNEIKPVVTYSIGTIASGSYFASIYSSKILANPGSVVGSIGVILEVPNVGNLLDKVGVEWRVIKSGKYKELGTAFRDWAGFEKDSLQNATDDIYKYFVSEVAKARKLDFNSSESFADGKVFVASKAKELGLIDDVSTLFRAEDELIKLAKVSEPIWRETNSDDRVLKSLIQESLKFAISKFDIGAK